ncbi:peptide transporter ptr2 [Geranomyces michiganensis]|nr:peptide transporter ptr2 [Geranomyces michiganensis]
MATTTPTTTNPVAKHQQPSQATLHEKNPDDHIVRIPTEDGFLKTTLPRIAGVIPLAAFFIVINEFCERFAYYGGSGVFQNYVSARRPQEPGSLGHPQSDATALSNFFTFFAYATPLLGAVVADQWLGKFKTILSFSVIYLAGFLLLTITSIPTGTDEDGFHIYSGAAFPGYVISLIIIGTGTGGIKSVVSPMCADQIPQEVYTVTKKGKQYIVDPDLTVQHLYNWFYWAINVGAMVGQLICTRLERNAFWHAFILPTCMFVLSIVVFVSGYKRYTHVPPGGSVILESWRCMRYGQTRRKQNPTAVHVPAGTNFPFLEWAKPIPGESVDEANKRTWNADFPQELRQTLKACSIFPLMSIYWVCYSQITNNLVSQAGQMNCAWNGKDGAEMPNDLVSILDPVALVILIPIFDAGVYPLLSRTKIEFGYIKRITLGFFLGALAMAYAAFTQKLIYDRGPNYDYANFDSDTATQQYNDISVYVQFPAYILIALSEIFASIGSLEYSYTHAPKNMKCFVSALALLPNAVSSLIGLFLSPAAKDPSLTWMYAGTGIAAFFSSILFWFMFRRFDDEDRVLKANAVAAEGGNNNTHGGSLAEGELPYRTKAAEAMAETEDRVHVR